MSRSGDHGWSPEIDCAGAALDILSVIIEQIIDGDLLESVGDSADESIRQRALDLLELLRPIARPDQGDEEDDEDADDDCEDEDPDD